MNLNTDFAKIYSTPFKSVYINKNESICYSVWHEENEFMTHDEYKKDALNMLEILLQNKFKYIIADNRATRFKFTDELDIWYRENFFEVLLKKSTLQKFAIVLNESLRLSVMVDEMFDNFPIVHKSFSSVEDAYKWVSYQPKK